MPRELVLICRGCGRKVWDDIGYLWVDTARVADVGQAQRAWEAEYRDGLMDMLDFLKYPEKVRWQAHHLACDPASEDSHYRLEARRLRTRADLLGWTAHLMGKNWLDCTDWSELLQESRQVGKQITPARPGAALTPF
ncbi:hypothetical protein [Streptomyces sp. NPDC049916]|uniref:hypothetical protein n=1 Tax=Streptomyces sp. NPDC049916 TaxID=3155156 RepID=UPI0034381D13